MSPPVGTSIHVLAELAGDEPLVLRMWEAPKYAVASSLLSVLARDDIQRSVIAMIEAGIAHLPFAPLLVEFSVAPDFRRFVLLDEAEDGFSAGHALLYRDEMADISPTKAFVAVRPCGLHVDRFSDESEGRAIGLAASIALLMLNIRGVDKQMIEPEALNRARQKRGKTRIPSHTVLRIGTIFDRSGRGSVPGVEGRHMPVHMRAGHVRMQACGEGFADRKAVFIPPVLVNYRPDLDARPRLPERVVAL
jgi:hypothetical protein